MNARRASRGCDGAAGRQHRKTRIPSLRQTNRDRIGPLESLPPTAETFSAIFTTTPRPPMTHDQAIANLDKIQTQELDLHHDLLLCAVRYARLRTDWRLAGPDERRTMDSTRTAAHNALIHALNILARAMRKAAVNTDWRKLGGENRQEIRDWACHVHAHLRIQAR